jgi:cell division protein ZapA
MAKVNLNINGKQYALGCDDGEEERLNRFGAILDGKVTDLADQFGQIGDLRLMVMAGITLLDEIDDLRRERDASISEATRTLERESQAALLQAQTKELTAIDVLNAAAEAIERMAVRFRLDDQAL